MKNFFNAIGMADMEKVHSAMIAWILDDENDQSLINNNGQASSSFSTLPIKERSSLLCNLFSISPTKDFQSIKTHVEWNDIDIMIETKDTNGINEIWVIENKLKSQEHMSNEKDANGTLVSVWQTEKYVNIIKNSFANYSRHYMLLSLGGDVAKGQIEPWTSFTYEKLALSLNNLSNLSNYVLINEYATALNAMIGELQKFLASKCLKNYQHVFNKIKKSNVSSTKIHPDEAFIVENRLETIFQKQFLAGMITKYNLPIKNIVNYDERNGMAMFIKPICPINDFELSIEFQGGTYKVGLLHKDYIKNGSNKHTHRLYGKWDNQTKKWTGSVYKEFEKLQDNGWRIALAKNLGSNPNNAKPRIALDKNIGKDWYNNPNNKFKTVYDEAVVIAKKISQMITYIP